MTTKPLTQIYAGVDINDNEGTTSVVAVRLLDAQTDTFECLLACSARTSDVCDTKKYFGTCMRMLGARDGACDADAVLIHVGVDACYPFMWMHLAGMFANVCARSFTMTRPTMLKAMALARRYHHLFPETATLLAAECEREQRALRFPASYRPDLQNTDACALGIALFHCHCSTGNPILTPE